MQLLDARRLTGPNHLAPFPLVLVELGLAEGETIARAEAAYLEELVRMRGALGLSTDIELVGRAHRGGVVFGYAAPIDVMLPLADVSEWAAESACAVLSGAAPHPLEPKRTEFAELLDAAKNPPLLALEAAAFERDMPFLWDDEKVSIGLGRKSLTFDRNAIPDVESIDWSDIGKIKVALVTGTNGKTTSSRLLAHIGRCAGIIVGSTSTDFVRVGDTILQRGDWTGPSAARVVLRHPEVQLAVLETARGGILRRGLAIEQCDAALVTNVAVDHVGGYGIDDLNAMTRVKGVVAEAVVPEGTVVLNAADPHLVAFAEGVAASVAFFANLDGSDARTQAAGRVIAEHIDCGGSAVFARNGEIVSIQAGTGTRTTFGRVADAPITFGGAAAYNVENVLAAVAMAQALWVDDTSIVRGLRTFTMAENPGRGQFIEKNGVQILLDFGHNTDGILAVMQLVQKLREARGRGGKLTVIAGSPGDRTDADLEDMVRAIATGKPDRVIVRELPKYLRGRTLGEIPAIFRRVLVAEGLADEAFEQVEGEVAALSHALSLAKPGDFVALLVHLEQHEVAAYLQTLPG